MVSYHNGGHNQLTNVCQNGSKNQWINFSPQEDKDLRQYINSQTQVFGVKEFQALFMTNFFLTFPRSYMCRHCWSYK